MTDKAFVISVESIDALKYVTFTNKDDSCVYRPNNDDKCVYRPGITYKNHHE